ncbi:MAG: undecaprenyl-diphosphate phosphatase [Clostridiales bacterium]|nr:undecaprenyl-diphosphate phosphatase [Clostridiales bacterium]
MEQLTYLKSVILGLIQGLTEFLPVSSSGHIMLAEEIFGLKLESGVAGAFTVMLHLGTLLAVAVFYFRRIIQMFAHPVKGELKLLILATLPTVAYALALKLTGWDDVIDSVARLLLPYAFLFTALILLLADGIGRARAVAKASHGRVKARDALIMGLMQCVGTFTGVSRSGSTVAGGLASGLKRKSAADFSFMMSIPAILGAAVLELMDVLKTDSLQSALSSQLPQILVGILAAFAAGLAAIALMIRAVKKSRLKWFSLYLTLLAAVIIINDFAHIW